MSLHMKRLAAPRAWFIKKKAHVWAPRPRPGAHPKDASIPIGLVLRDHLGICDRAAEARRLVGNREVLVDGKPARNAKQVVGFMDVISIPKMDVHYRVFFDRHGRVLLNKADPQNAAWKLARVDGKSTVRGGKTQVNLHDGRNILVKEANLYKTGDTLRVHVPDQKVQGHYPFAEGSVAVITGGSHIGEVATVKGVEVTRSPQPNIVTLTTEGGKEFRTVRDYVFVIGKERPEISLPSTGGNQ
jgi:small subunit ribosomal protein S4e